MLFARLGEEPDDSATLSALCDLALTRGQPELAQGLIRRARATGRELPKELQALARRANATPSVLPQVEQTARDVRSCCLLPLLVGLFCFLGALLGVGVMSLPDLRNRLKISGERARLSAPSFAERSRAAAWLTQGGLRLAHSVAPQEVAAISGEAHAALAPGPLTQEEALEALTLLEASIPREDFDPRWDSGVGLYQKGWIASGRWGAGWAEAVASGLSHPSRVVRERASGVLFERYDAMRRATTTELPEEAWATVAETYATRPELRANLLPLLVDERSLPPKVITLTNSGRLLVPPLPSSRTPDELRAHFREQPRALLALLLDAHASEDEPLREVALTEARWVLPRYRAESLGRGEWDPRLQELTLARLRRGSSGRAPKRKRKKKVRWTPIAELALGLGIEESAELYLRLVRSSYERYKRGKLSKARSYSRRARRSKRSSQRATSWRQDARRARHQARNPDSSWIQRYSRPLRQLPREKLEQLQLKERNHGASVVIEDALGGGS